MAQRAKFAIGIRFMKATRLAVSDSYRNYPKQMTAINNDPIEHKGAKPILTPVFSLDEPEITPVAARGMWGYCRGVVGLIPGKSSITPL